MKKKSRLLLFFYYSTRTRVRYSYGQNTTSRCGRSPGTRRRLRGGQTPSPPRLPVRKRTCKRRRRCRRRRCRHAVAVDSVARADHHGPQRRVRRVHRGRLHDRLANVLR